MHWTEHYFGSAYRRSIPHRVSHTAARHQARLLVEQLSLIGQAVLDVPCGYGRLLHPLVQQGAAVTGVERNGAFVCELRERLQADGLHAQVVQADFRSFQLPSTFDLALCMGSSIGYYGVAADLEFFARLRRHLRPGGRLLVEFDDTDWLTRAAPRRHWYEGEDGWFALGEFLERPGDRTRCVMRHHFLHAPSGTWESVDAHFDTYTPAALTSALHEVGFTQIQPFILQAEGAMSPATQMLLAHVFEE